MAFSYSGSSKVQLVMSLILFILYGCSVWKKKGEKRVRNDVRREREEENESSLERERRYGVAEEDFQCSCMYNE